MFGNTRQSINVVLFIILGLIGLGSVFFVMVTRNQAVSSISIATNTPLSQIQPDSKISPTSLPILLPRMTALTTLPAPTSEGLEPIPIGQRGLITNGDRTTNKVALTFDVCQAEGDLSGYDAGIVKVLSEYQTPATFFLGGAWIKDHLGEANELAANPLFELGNHAWSHADFSKVDTQKMYQEIQLAQEQLFGLTGKHNNLFRLPYGFYTDEALDFIGENGLYTIQWDVVSGDPDPNITAPAMIDWVLQQVQPGSIVIMHANGRGWHTAEALPILIQSLRDQGYTLVTISDLLNIQSP